MKGQKQSTFLLHSSEKRAEVVCKRFKSLSAEHKELKPTRLMLIIAVETGMTQVGVYKILVKRGLHKVSRRNNKKTSRRSKTC